MKHYASTITPDPDAAHDEMVQREIEIRLCKDCGHFRAEDCWAPGNMKRDLIHGGKTTRNSISFVREADALCGEQAAWFVAKIHDLGGKAA